MARNPRTSAPRTEAPGKLALGADYRGAILRCVIGAAGALASRSGGGVGRRRLINFLRGNQPPPSGSPPLAARAGFGLLESHRGGWVEELVDRLVEEGYLVFLPGPAPRLTVSPSGRSALSPGASFPAEVLPSRPLLGEHPEAEERLRALRRKLAAADGRAAYGIFPNSVLAELASRRPRSLADLAAVPGLGEVRIRKYGRRILAALEGRRR